MAKIAFQPPPSSYGKDPNLIWLTTRLGEVIPAFYVHRRNASFTLLFSHGNAEDLGLIIRYFKEVSAILEVNVFSYEYTGYGLSSGEQPLEATAYADVEAAYMYLRDSVRTPWTQIVPYGRSIGTGPSVHLATKTAVRGLILQSGMTSIYRIAFQFRFTLPGDLFANIDKIGDVCCPVFIIHGTQDEIVPCRHGRGLYKRCQLAGNAYDPFWVEDADHNNLESQAGDAFFDRIRRFLEHLDSEPIPNKLRIQAERPDL